MTRWEYQEVSVPPQATLRRLNELGKEGWEAFSAETRTNPHYHVTVTIVWLKREIKGRKKS